MKTVVISGGSDGLGLEIAKTLSLHHNVIILSPTQQKLKKVAKQLNTSYQVCDVTNYQQCQAAVKAIKKEFKTIDILINNAGLWIQGELDDNDPDYMKKVIEVNALGVVNLTKSAIPTMKKQKEGTIININSQAGLYAKQERTVYNLTKWGITGFSKSLQSELSKYGIKVTDLHPGKMKTEMFSKMGIEKDMSNGLDLGVIAQTISFIVALPPDVVIPELGIKHIHG